MASFAFGSGDNFGPAGALKGSSQHRGRAGRRCRAWEQQDGQGLPRSSFYTCRRGRSSVSLHLYVVPSVEIQVLAFSGVPASSQGKSALREPEP